MKTQTIKSYIVSDISNTSAVISNANDLFEKQQDFDIRTNLELYNLLAGIYSLYLTTIKLGSMDEVIKEMKAGLKCVNVKTQKNTPNLTVFVRYVYRADRKKAYNYTQVLLLAEKEQVKAQDLSEFIIDVGGIEACKRKMNTGNNHNSNENYEGKLEKIKKMDAIATVDFDHGSVDLSDESELVLVIARTSKHGKLELLNVVSETTEAMLKSAIKKVDIKEEKVKEKQVKEQFTLNNAINEADYAASNPYFTAVMQAKFI